MRVSVRERYRRCSPIAYIVTISRLLAVFTICLHCFVGGGNGGRGGRSLGGMRCNWAKNRSGGGGGDPWVAARVVRWQLITIIHLTARRPHIECVEKLPPHPPSCNPCPTGTHRQNVYGRGSRCPTEKKKKKPRNYEYDFHGGPYQRV